MSAATVSDQAIAELAERSQQERWPYTPVMDWLNRAETAAVDLPALAAITAPQRFAQLDLGAGEIQLPAGSSLLQPQVGVDWTAHTYTLSVPAGCHAEVLLLSDASEQGQRQIHWKVDRDAQLSIYRLPLWSPSATVFDNWSFEIEQHAKVHVHELLLGQGMHRNRVLAKLRSEGAQLHWNGLALLGGRSKAVLDMRIEHGAENTVSRLDLRNALAGRARRSAIGMVHVAPEGLHTDSAQICRSLLLGSRAAADMRPELEIFADQVQCAHGATCGELDQTALHYLRSRGLDVLTARKLLLESFARPLLSEWPEDLQQAIEPALNQTMQHLGDALAAEVTA